MARRKRLGTGEDLQSHIDKESEANNGVVDLHALAEKLIESGEWEDPEYDRVKACQKALAKVARKQTYVDPQGREVRKRHAFTFTDERGQLRWLWADIELGTPEQIHKSLQIRRRGVFGEVHQIYTAKESFNDNNKYGAEIAMSFNFDEDIAETESPTEYPDHPE